MKKLLTSLALVLSFGWSVFAAVPPIYRQPWTTNRIPHDATATNVTIWTSNGPGELIRGDGGSAFLELATARVHRDVDDEFLTLLGGTAKSTASFVEIYGQDHHTGLGGTTISLHHRQDEPTLPGGAFRIRSAPTNSTTSALRFDLAGQTGNILHYPIWTNQSLVYTGLFMNVNIDTTVAAGSKLLDLATNSKSLFVVDDDARVGINTNNPAANLSIYASSATAALNINSRHQQNILTVLTNGNVGIGIASPKDALHIYDISEHMTAGEISSGYFGIAFGVDAAASINNHSIGGNGTLTIINRPTGGDISFRENNVQQAIIKTGGNVGIGTNAPQANLHIAGSTADIWMSRTAGGADEWSMAVTTTGDKGWSLYNRTDAAYRFIVDDSGQVGIGTTSPGAKLDITQTTANQGLDITETNSIRVRAGYNSSKDGYMAVYNNSGAVGAAIASDEQSYFLGGNVGIGTNAPQADLSVYASSATAALKIDSAHVANIVAVKTNGWVGLGTGAPNSDYATLTGPILELQGPVNPAIVIHDTGQAYNYTIVGQADDLALYYKDTNIIVFQNNGNVGIGTNSPQATLHTHGTLLVQNCVSNSIGYNCSASGIGSTVGGGTNNTASGNSSSVPGGRSGLANKYGQVAYASGRFSAQGDAQRSDLTARIQTTDATANVEMFLDGASQRCTISSGKSWFYTVRIIAKQSGVANDAAYEFKGVIRNQGGTTTLNQYSKTIIWEDATHSVGWDSQVTADDANDALKLDATGPAGTNVYWVGHIQLVEVQY